MRISALVRSLLMMFALVAEGFIFNVAFTPAAFGQTIKKELLYNSALGLLRFEREGKDWVLKTANPQNSCGFPMDFEVFRGELLAGTAQGNVSLCRVAPGCSETELAQGVFTFSRAGEAALLAIEPPHEGCPRVVPSTGLFMSRVQETPVMAKVEQKQRPGVTALNPAEKCLRAKALVDEGNQSLAVNNNAEARARFGVAAALCDSLPGIRMGLAEVALRRGQTQSAERSARELLDADPQSAAHYRLLIRVLLARSKTLEAERYSTLLGFIEGTPAEVDTPTHANERE